MQRNMSTPFRVELDDGSIFESRYRPVDIVAAERHFNGLEGRSYEGTWYMAFHALRAEQKYDGTFAEFVEHLVHWVEGADGVAAAKEIDAAGEATTEPKTAAPGSDSVSPPSPTEPASALAS